MSATPLERISWDVYCPFPRVRAQAEFTFAEKSRRSGSRYPKLRGSGYTAKRYAEAVDVVSLDLGTDDYLVLKHRDFDFSKGSAGKVVMSYPHLRRFVEGLHEALEMVRDECFEEAENGAYQLTEKGYDASIHVPDLFGGASVAFEPVICEVVVDDDVADGEEPDYSGEPGMRMYLNGNEMFADVTLDQFATFVQFYERFDLFATSRTAVQIAVVQMGGIPGVSMTRTAAPQPTRKPTVASANGLGKRKA
jgi:hypothetical protein